ncbi:MAG: hypothetical protein VB031_07345 [Eubacteriaceae bacterium]|nr:hypothetical protein [Eubacteriaceae bacterium]
MFDNIITDDSIDMLLRQQDAKEIVSKEGHIGRVVFKVAEGIDAVYLYEVTDDGIMYLQRLSPDPINYGRMNDAPEAIKNIAYDIQNFKRAFESGVYNEFALMTENMNELQMKMEELFLMYHPDVEDMKEIYDAMKEMHKKMQGICL